MGTGLFFIDVIIIAIVILPFVLFIGGSKKRTQQFKRALQSEAAQNHCKLQYIEVHGNFAIGLDIQAQKVLFYKKTAKESYTTIIDLKTVSSCKAIKETKRVKDKTTYYDVVINVQLSFLHNNGNTVSNLLFYDNDDELTLNDEIAVADKWQSEINNLIKGNTIAFQAKHAGQQVVAIN